MEPDRPKVKILYAGMQGSFSSIPLNALIEAGCVPSALITPPPAGMRRAFARVRPPESSREDDLYRLASRHGIPIYEVGKLGHPEALTFLTNLRPDLLVVACFPGLFPPAWLAAPRLGCINLHPSLLPAYRGPTPLEEQLARGEQVTGITLHFMDERADTGDIIAQEAIPVPPGATLEGLNRLTAEAGARLLVAALQNPENFPRRPQGPA